MASSAYRDFEAWEIASAIIIAICVQVGTGTVMYLSKKEDKCLATPPPSCPAGEIAKCGPGGWECRPSCSAPPPSCPEGEQPTCEADAWECKPPEEIVAVKPVIDSDAIAAAEKAGKKAVLPPEWDRAPEAVKKAIQATPIKPPDTTTASTKVENDDIPDAGKVERDWGKTDESLEPKDAEVASNDNDAAPEDGGDSGTDKPSGEDAGPDATTDDAGGTSQGGGGGCAEGDPNCIPSHIANAYAGKLSAFLRAGFAVSGLGLPPEEMKKLRAGGSVTISPDGTITGFSLGSSGNPAFDAAAKAHLQSKVGKQVPPPPEDYPQLMKPSQGVTLTCGSGCN
ncbi:MAG: hypothetical protein HOW73_45170 [Polyangiaceae bacterium]|nr:hypothetical protein [Polyangiaceae bacterium]